MLSLLLIAVTSAVAVAIFYRLRLLTAGGAAATLLLAVLLWGIAGWRWLLPMLVFFLSSNLFSRIGRSRKARFDLIFEKGGRRDAAQVLANGGVAALMVIFWLVSKSPTAAVLYLTAVACSAADTWATELGTLHRGRPRLITSLKPVAPGTSGGISIAGLLSALGGAALVACSGWPLLSAAGTDQQFLITIAAAGWAGSLIDSLMGASLQAQFRCRECGNITERRQHCGQTAQQISGYRWMNNDVVNFLSSLGAVLLAWLAVNL